MAKKNKKVSAKERRNWDIVAFKRLSFEGAEMIRHANASGRQINSFKLARCKVCAADYLSYNLEGIKNCGRCVCERNQLRINAAAAGSTKDIINRTISILNGAIASAAPKPIEYYKRPENAIDSFMINDDGPNYWRPASKREVKDSRPSNIIGKRVWASRMTGKDSIESYFLYLYSIGDRVNYEELLRRIDNGAFGLWCERNHDAPKIVETERRIELAEGNYAPSTAKRKIREANKVSKNIKKKRAKPNRAIKILANLAARESEMKANKITGEQREILAMYRALKNQKKPTNLRKITKPNYNPAPCGSNADFRDEIWEAATRNNSPVIKPKVEKPARIAPNVGDRVKILGSNMFGSLIGRKGDVAQVIWDSGIESDYSFRKLTKA